MKHIDLFSGIGGFALAAEMVWNDVEHVFCDNEPFSQAVLAKHWPNSKIYGDIRTFTADAERQRQSQPQGGEQEERGRVSDVHQIDLLTGGFPCQPFSQAGRRRGTQDDRHLWPEMLRVIREFNPRWVVGENVGGLITWDGGVVLEQIHADLEGEGYEVQAFIIPAVAVNAPHRRDRVWIVANRNLNNDGREQTESERPSVGSSEADSDTSDARHGERARNKPFRRIEAPDWNRNWLEVATRLCGVFNGLPRRLDRNPRLKGLGNAIVPQVAAEIFRAIKATEASR